MLSQFRELYKPNWLQLIRDELQTGTGIELPDPPYVGTLRPGEIGSNTYLFS